MKEKPVTRKNEKKISLRTPPDKKKNPDQPDEAERVSRPQSRRSAPDSGQAKPPNWKEPLKQIPPLLDDPTKEPDYTAQAREILVYAIDVETSRWRGAVVLQLYQAKPKKDGLWSVLKPARFGQSQSFFLGPEDRKILSLLQGAKPMDGRSHSIAQDWSQVSQFQLTPEAARMILPLACATQRCLWEDQKTSPESLQTLQWDEGEPWRLRLELAPAGRGFLLRGDLRRQEERLPLNKVLTLPGSGLAAAGATLFALKGVGEQTWMKILSTSGPLAVPAAETGKFLSRFFQADYPPELELPPVLKLERRTLSPQPALLIHPSPNSTGTAQLRADLFLNYEGVRIPHGQGGSVFYRPQERLLLERDIEKEAGFIPRLGSLGLKLKNDGREGPSKPYWVFPAVKLPDVVSALAKEGWHVEALGKAVRSQGTLSAEVKSGLEWFDLNLSARFDGIAVPVEGLLEALQRGNKTVVLDDGTYGVLPEEWLAKYGFVSRLGAAGKEGLRFMENQVGLLDALLAVEPTVSCDAIFQAARAKLRQFEEIKPADPQGDFHGALRPYQREGLGWMGFLEAFGFGGCLADDMGLGKTVQVLALLEKHRSAASANPPPEKTGKPRISLAVVPKSLIFNWRQEAAKFTPQLRLLDHTGAGRAKDLESFENFDLVLTTYGTLRRDAGRLSQIPFHYVILDEAHAVKNSKSESAKAVRLLKSRHRLALTGTPVQNNMDELWSLFEFLNPGMLGSSKALSLVSGMEAGEKDGPAFLARALRPFLLRRTKDTVAKDLPSKTEQALYCDMDASQHSLYESLRLNYRDGLMKKVEKQGLNRSKMHVLEALLRLRQAACHPGLIDPRRSKELGAKLDMLLPQLQEVLSEGHKALVFSQFTSFLAILKQHLDPLGIPYAYLDGKSRDRQEQVERFQGDKNCGLFLISLKAGGLGLNLTAADYVYLLDPWWNPAVEAQAVDRAHRIGQVKKVFAYRLITRGTVEEKILEMQAKKRKLVEALFGGETGVLKGLTQEELEWLLS